MNSHDGGDSSTFKSYITEPEYVDISITDVQQTQLLPGETAIQSAHKVLMYNPAGDKVKSRLGILTITTFKLSFVCYNNLDVDEKYQHNLLFRKNECCLSAIDVMYQMGDKSKKKLQPGQSVSSKVKDLVIVCKNMRMFGFSFKHAEKDAGKLITNTLIHHAYPKKYHLLFAYEYQDPIKSSDESNEQKITRLFITQEDWIKELQRTKCGNSWKTTDVNRNFEVSSHLPKYTVIPRTISESVMIIEASRYFRNSGFPLWVWGTEYASLVRMPELLPGVVDRKYENIMMENIRSSSETKTPPMIADLGKECPTVKDIQHSYNKLRNLCTPDSTKSFQDQDFKFYSLLDSSKWLHHVSKCLTKAVELTAEICDNKTTVVLQEDKGQDMNCIISSLIQLLADSHWRTRRGIQSLIQKEWVTMGHPFGKRLGHVIDPDVEPSFLFLLFLDCVWQLLQQYPDYFQFTETFLTTLWDSAHISLFDTFIFNCEHDRDVNLKHTGGLTVWDWSRQFSNDEIILFNNPLFNRKIKSRIYPQTGLSALDFWRQNYLRWIPSIEIRNGGNSQVEVCNRFLADDINLLEYKVKSMDLDAGLVVKTKEERLQVLKGINSFYPFGYQTTSDSNVIDSDLLAAESLETQSILNLNNL